ncbi:MAG: hypothetical protein ACOYNC_14840 [Bacteroidales bacterium]
MKISILITIISFFLLTSCGGNSAPDNSDAKEAARAAIIHSLKDPKSASFHHDEVIKKYGDSTFLYTETVNATNSFGGSIAQIVTIEVKWTGGDPSVVENWTFSKLQFNPR